MKYDNLTLRTKLIGGFAVLLMLLITVSLLGASP